MFAPAAVRASTPARPVHRAAIDACGYSGSIDFVLDLANPVPAKATLAFLGLELDDWLKFAEPAHEVVYTRPGTPEFQRAVDGQQWMFETLVAAVADRRQSPRDDNLSRIVHADVDGRTFADEEVVSLLGTIINGGVDTTTALFANAIEYLDRNHDLRDRLVDEPELIPTATEEFLRYFSPVQRSRARSRRTPSSPISTSSGAIACSCASRSANRDGREFPDADRVRRGAATESARRVRHRQAPLHRVHARSGRVRDHARHDAPTHPRLHRRPGRNRPLPLARHRERLREHARHASLPWRR